MPRTKTKRVKPVEPVTTPAERAWAARHPAAAAAERALRDARAAVEARWDHKQVGTAATHEAQAGRRDGAMRRLYMSEAIDGGQLDAAIEIADMYEMIGRDASVRTASLETRIDGGRRGQGLSDELLGQVRHEIAYSRWRAAIGAMAAPLLDMIAGDVGLKAATRRHHIGERRMLAALRQALDLWWALKGEARRDVDQRALDRAHADILR